MKTAYRIAALSLVLFLAGFSHSSLAATLYVEKWGSNANDCKKSSPCLTISMARSLSKRNGRIVVGPGIYRENLTINVNRDVEPLDGLKIESTAGRHATFITAANSDFPTVNIYQSRVRFGKKGKGFTVMGATATGNVGINIEGSGVSNVRIEGNRASANYLGISLRGEKHLLQNNVAMGNLTRGIYCLLCSRVTIRGNTIRDNFGDGMAVVFSSRITIEKNIATGNDGRGIVTDTTSGTNNLKIRDNVATFNEGTGIRAGDVSDGLVQGNISSRNVGHGLFVREGPEQQGGKIIGNLLVDNEGSGIDFNDTDLSNIKAEGNTSIGNDNDGFLFSLNGAPLDSMKSNNSIDNDSPGTHCGINNTSVQLLTYSRHFFGSDDVACGPVLPPVGTAPTKPSALKIRKASGL